MKKILSSLFVAASLFTGVANAGYIKGNSTIAEDHMVFVSKTVDIDIKGATKKLVFFGDLNEYSEKANDLASSGANGLATGLQSAASGLAKGMGEAALQGAGMGMGIGLIFGGIKMASDHNKASKKFILIYDVENSKKEVSRVFVSFMSDESHDREVIKQYLEKQI